MDLNHAAKAAVSLKIPYKEFIKQFLKLRPEMFYISDGKQNTEKDEHLAVGEGDYDFEFFIKCIKENPSRFVTLETPRIDTNSLCEDIQNVNKLKTQEFYKI